jgi:hypothetical protein
MFARPFPDLFLRPWRWVIKATRAVSRDVSTLIASLTDALPRCTSVLQLIDFENAVFKVTLPKRAEAAGAQRKIAIKKG